MKRDKRITNKDLFLFYPYKKNIITDRNTIPQPYIKKSEEITDHQFSIDYTQWTAVIDDYISVIVDTLITGREYVLPTHLGKIQLRKYKTKRLIDWKTTKESGKKTYYKGSDSNRIILKWYRDYKISRFRYRFHWKIRMAKNLTNAIYKQSVKNKNYVYNILDV